MKNNISRRGFLKLSGTIAALAVAATIPKTVADAEEPVVDDMISMEGVSEADDYSLVSGEFQRGLKFSGTPIPFTYQNGRVGFLTSSYVSDKSIPIGRMISEEEDD